MRRYKVLGFRRRRLGITNYEKRLNLLKSGKTRIVVRRSNNYITIQFINYIPTGDKVLLTITSRSLKKIGWKHSCKNIPAAYLTGVYSARVALGKNIIEGIPDLGIYNIIKGNFIFAVLKGILDGGLKIPVSGDVFPVEGRLKGDQTKNKDVFKKDFESLLNKIRSEK